MKIHPLILLLLVACALGGAFAIGRLSQVSSAPPPPQATPPAPPAQVVVQPAAPIQLVPTGNQKAEIETPQGKFTVEAGITVR